MVTLIKSLLKDGKRRSVFANITTENGERGQVTSVRATKKGRILITVSMEEWNIARQGVTSRVVKDLGIRKFSDAVLDDIARCLVENY